MLMSRKPVFTQSLIMSVWWWMWAKWWKIIQEQRAESLVLLPNVGTGVFFWQGPLQAWKGLGRNWFVEHCGFSFPLEPFFLYRVRP